MFAACLTLVASMSSAVKADPLVGTVTLAANRNPAFPALPLNVYSSGPIDLSQLPQGLPLTGFF
jgi:hypothetical protein